MNSDKATEDAAKLLMQDPTIYAYDEIYDEMKKQTKLKKQPIKQQKSAAKQSKYVRSILSTADRRAKEHQIIHQKMQSKRLKKDEHEEVFVTSSYLKKLEQKKKYEQQQKKQQAYDNEHSIKNKDKQQYEFTASLFRKQFQKDNKKSEDKKPDKMQ